MSTKNIKLIECPRDAMQGWKTSDTPEKKTAYINALLKCGFDTIDFGSFVSPKAIPQMADTVEVLAQLDLASFCIKLTRHSSQCAGCAGRKLVMKPLIT